MDTVLERALADRILGSVARQAVPVYGFLCDRDKQYKKGDKSSIIGVLENLPIPVEDSLSWEQVLEVRADQDAQDRLRRFSRWLDTSMEGESVEEITDLILIRIEDYKRALRKHGIKTLTGLFERIVDWKALLSRVAAFATTATLSGGSQSIALLGAGSLLVGDVAVSVLESRLNLSEVHREHEDVSYVFELSAKLQD